jgi:hypothetical protein
MNKSRITIAAACLATIASGIAANAQYFDYKATFSPTSGTQALSDGSYGFTITGGSNNTGIGDSSISLGDIKTFAPLNGANTATFNVPYTIALAITESNKGGTVTGPTITEDLSGTISGTVSANSANLSNTFTSTTPLVYTFPDGTAETVSGFAYVAPGAPGASTDGAFGASVKGNGIVNLTNTPEPGSAAMFFGMSIPGILLGMRRRRNRSV